MAKRLWAKLTYETHNIVVTFGFLIGALPVKWNNVDKMLEPLVLRKELFRWICAAISIGVFQLVVIFKFGRDVATAESVFEFFSDDPIRLILAVGSVMGICLQLHTAWKYKEFISFINKATRFYENFQMVLMLKSLPFRRHRRAGLCIRFVTNTTKKSKRSLMEPLSWMGLAVQSDEIFTSRRQESLLLSGAELIAIHKGRYYRDGDELSLGPGPFVRALEFASSKEAIVIGKPEPEFFSSAVESTGCKVDAAVMIGDDVQDDVCGAIKLGIKGILVKTGNYRENDEKNISPPPHRISKSFAAAVDIILDSI